ncbi:MAG TPA: tetratricopeptide repeat protein [Tepidisphaeraceae bacterium]
MEANSQHTLTRGLAYHQSGQFAQAESLYRRVLSREPNNPAAIHLLGLLAHHTGHNADAETLMLQSLELAPDVADFHNNFGTFLLNTGRNSEASARFSRALELNPASSDAWNNLGAAHEADGNLPEARTAYERAVQLNPQIANPHSNLARVLRQQNHLDASIQHAQLALQLVPNHVEALNTLGMVLQQIGRAAEALECHRRALAVSPNNFDAVQGVAGSLIHLGRLQEAEQASRRALELNPHNAPAANDLALILKLTGRFDEAVYQLQRTTQLDPDLAAPWSNLGAALLERGQALLGIDAFRNAIRLKPDFIAAHSNLLLALHCDPSFDDETIYREHLHFAEVHEAPLLETYRPHDNSCDPDRPLRIGYVSRHFANHAVATFVEPIIRAHDRTRFQITCYADVAHEDQTTARIKAAAWRWESIVSLTDEQVAQKVRENGEDILIDLTGHISGSRLRIFACKPAPIQITYIGYQNTTGLRSIGYRLTDPHADPLPSPTSSTPPSSPSPGTPGEGRVRALPNQPETSGDVRPQGENPTGPPDCYYTEKLVRLPRSFFVYQPPADAPDPTPPPSESTGHITFGSLNNAMKLNDPLIATWCQILHAVPGSRFIPLVNFRGETEQLTWRRFEHHGISRDRVRLLIRGSRLAYLQTYASIDICLDPFPFSGHTTTCDALWMGVPVITRGAGNYAGRMSRSVLANLNLQELIAESTDNYITLAQQLAADRHRLAHYRTHLRPLMKSSYICNETSFTRDLEDTYRKIWNQYCASTA